MTVVVYNISAEKVSDNPLIGEQVRTELAQRLKAIAELAYSEMDIREIKTEQNDTPLTEKLESAHKVFEEWFEKHVEARLLKEEDPLE